MDQEFGKRLRALRERSRPVKSMRVTSELMGLPTDAIRRYERADAVPTVAALEKIADYYGVSTDYLLGRKKT